MADIKHKIKHYIGLRLPLVVLAVIFVLVLIYLGVLYSDYFKSLFPAAKKVFSPEFSISPNTAIPPSTDASSRAMGYTVSSNQHGPAITRIILDPDALQHKAGEALKFWVFLRDTRDVSRVWAQIDTDQGAWTVDLSGGLGLWYGEWQADVTHDKFFHTYFFAANSKGETSKVEMNWTNN